VFPLDSESFPYLTIYFRIANRQRRGAFCNWIPRGELKNPMEENTKPLTNWKIQLAFGIAILTLLIMGAISYHARVLSNESERWVEHTQEVLENLQGLQLAMETVKSSYREFALTGDESALGPFLNNKLSAMRYISALRNLTLDNASQQRRIADMESVAAQRIQFAEMVVSLRRIKDSDAVADAIRSSTNRPTVDGFSAEVHEAQAEELRLLKLRDVDTVKRQRQTKVNLVALTIVALLIVFAAGWNVQRDSIRREHLLDSEEATAALLDLTHDAIFVRSLQDEVVYWNKSAEGLYGWSKEVLGRSTQELLHTVFPAPLAEIETEVLRKGYWEGELIHQHLDGTSLTVSSRWAVQMDGSGKPVAILESNRDISQRQQEERRFHSLMQAGPDAMVVVNEAGEIVLLNLQAERRFGYSRDELLGQNIKKIIPVGFAERLIADGTRTTAEVLMQLTDTSVELLGQHKDGSEFPIEIMLSPLENIHGTLITAAIRDITARKAAQEVLRQTEERWSLVVANVMDYAIVMLDLDGLVVIWNEGAERIKGYRAEDIIGQHFSCFYTADDISDGLPVSELATATRYGRSEDEGWRVRKDGSRFYANDVITALRDNNGLLRGFGKITRDITERIRTEEQRTKTAAELKRSNDQLEQFAFVASHDLQEPLRMVASYTQLLARRYRGQLDSDADEFIAYAVDGCNRMQSLIRDLLAYSRSGADKKLLREISGEAALKEALTNLRVSIEDSGALVTNDPLPAITSDDTQLVQVFQNLVGNAIKYHGASTPLVHVSAVKNADKEWIFSVRDNGLGIAPQYFERIFTIFQRLHGKHEFGGTGIGLAICKKIVEQLGGRIWVESELEKGSTFHFALPVNEGI
jgi:PAS domain S-box-containing protein